MSWIIDTGTGSATGRRGSWAIWLMLAACLPATGSNGESGVRGQCDTVAQCAAQGEAAYRAGDYGAAKALFAQQVAWAEQARTDCANEGEGNEDECPPVAAVAYNNAALAALRHGFPGEAKAWLRIAPHSEATRFNAAKVYEALRRSPLPEGPAGEYWEYAGYGAWSALRVTADGDGWRVEFDGLRFSGRGMTSGPNMGEFDERVTIGADNTATARLGREEAPCDVAATFAPGSIELETRASHRDSDCGFGFGVVAAGTFQRVR